MCFGVVFIVFLCQGLRFFVFLLWFSFPDVYWPISLNRDCFVYAREKLAHALLGIETIQIGIVQFSILLWMPSRLRLQNDVEILGLFTDPYFFFFFLNWLKCTTINYVNQSVEHTIRMLNSAGGFFFFFFWDRARRI